jgi:F0F1-type ATP synthase assembly protein I
MDDDTSRDGLHAEDKYFGVAAGWSVLSYLISGPLVYGGLGWLLDWWLGTEVFLPVGLVAGMALSFYAIWLRYVRQQPASLPRTGGSDEHHPHHDQRSG